VHTVPKKGTGFDEALLKVLVVLLGEAKSPEKPVPFFGTVKWPIMASPLVYQSPNCSMIYR
jgi:hypothetical protein